MTRLASALSLLLAACSPSVAGTTPLAPTPSADPAPTTPASTTPAPTTPGAPAAPSTAAPNIPGVPKVPKPPVKKPGESSQPTKRPTDQEIGQNLWKQSCWQCHGERGLGDGPAAAALVGGVPTLQGRVRSVNAETIQNIDALVDAVQVGKGRMPAYSEDIDRGDTRKIIFYLRDQLEGKGPGGAGAEKPDDAADAPEGDGPGAEGQ